MFRYFQTVLGFIGEFEFVQIFLGQSIKHVPNKLLEKIILLTIIVATVKIMNDFLLDALLIQFENEEMPFDSFEDLYNSKLQTYTNLLYLSNPKFLEISESFPYLIKILNSTLTVNKMNSCLNTIMKWKNVSCIDITIDPEYYVSYFRNPDGSAAIKAALPYIYETVHTFYQFANGSPYAIKFQNILQKVEESNLFHWPALVYNDSIKKSIEEINKSPITSEVTAEHLLSILSFGYSLSVTAFCMEFLTFAVIKLKISNHFSKLDLL